MFLGLHILPAILAAILLLPAMVFCIECAAALLPLRRFRGNAAMQRPRCAIVMPAHNEQAGIESAIRSVLPQLQDGDRLLVVADNCTDRTADVARSCGALVVERNDPERRGKGYALDCGLNYLTKDAPEIIIIMDSDCVAGPDMVGALVHQASATNRPAQAVYLLTSPSEPQPRDTVSALAFMVKNLVRPRGLARMGLPCLLTGTGMAFPWQIIRQARLASGNIVEDLQLSIDLTLAGHAPLLCPQASVTGKLPKQGRAARTQRTRWEHGYLQTATQSVPRLLMQGILRINREVLSVALDLSVPPLALLVLMMSLALLTAVAATLLGTPWHIPAILAVGLAAVGACVISSWARFGRDSLPATALLACPLYIAGKLPIYFNFAVRRESRWIRTDRGDGDELSPEPAGPERLPTILLHGVRFHSIRETECVSHVIDELANSRGGMLVTPNLDHLNRLQTDSNYARLVAESDVVVADGMPLVWASRVQRTPLPERVAGSDLIISLSKAASEAGRSVYLLGGSPCAAEKAADVLREMFPQLIVRGFFCPPMGFDTNPEAIAEIIDKLSAAKPDIVYVGLGSPKQERLIHELREWLPQAWWLGVGYSFSFLAGDGSRAPRWMRRAGLEWLHRLAHEPRRLARRYLIEGLPFASRLLARSVFAGLTGAAKQEANSRPSAASPGPAKPAVSPKPVPRKQLATLVHQSFADGFNSQMHLARNSFQTRTSTVLRPRRDNQIKTFVLLGGSLRPTPFRAAINRSILDMPIERNKRLLRHWQLQALELAKSEQIEQLLMRVLVDRDSHLPAAAPADGACSVSIERDAAQFRGTGGVLRDLAGEYEDDDLLLVANGAQLLTLPLPEMVDQLYQADSDVSFAAHQDGTPSGLMLIRCAALRGISEKGYVDMKEQALPAIARRFRVTHIDYRRPSGLLLRSYQDYLAAVRWRHHSRLVEAMNHADLLDAAAHDPNRPDARRAGRGHRLPGFSIVEDGALVDPSATLHDCVVLRGARVGANAVVARSLLCAGSALGDNETAIDQLMTAASAFPTHTHRFLQPV
jgi:exopolysaccharide biosynthesis WecB/TagA/CpsF family protein